MPKISDLITLAEIKTVIHLSEALGKEVSALQDEFVLTKEVSRAFQSIYNSLAEEKGKGIFIEGGYGTGKSHFLVALYLYLKEQIPPSISNLAKPKGPWLIIPISLLDYSSEIRLQEIVLEAIDKALERYFHKPLIPTEFIKELTEILKTKEEPLKKLAKKLNIPKEEILTLRYWPYLYHLFQSLNLPYRPVLDRGASLRQLNDILKEKGYKGTILLLDELSEFLKAKSNIAAFQEDIRFLQFLGEASSQMPLWIIASLQESLETTGAIPQDSFNKIKDRYPVRLLFRGSHIEEIISTRLVKKRHQAKAYLEKVYEKFKYTFNCLPFSWEKWLRLYPIHPLTIQLLDELRWLFSQHRGAIDFIYSRLKGDTKRQIPPLLEAPDHTLLTPSYIFDHFLDRIRQGPETAPYYEKVFCFYEKFIQDLFCEAETQKVALSLIKLLILLAISPIKHQPNTKWFTLALLYPFTDLDSSLNFRFIYDILNQLSQKGAYLCHEKRHDFLEDKFYLDLEEDTLFGIKSHFEKLKKTILPQDERIYQFIYTKASSNIIPFKELNQRDQIETNITWQNTPRQGRIYFINASEIFEFLKLNEIESHLDFHLFIIRLPLERGFTLPSLPCGVGVWVPKVLNEQYLKEAFIYEQLLAEYQSGAIGKGEKIKKILLNHYEEALSQATKELIWAYRQGILYFGPKETVEVVVLTANNWLGLLENMTSFILKNKYPLHHLIAPYTLTPPFFQRQKLVENLIIPGEASLKPEQKDIKLLIEGLIQPLGILKKTGRNYQIEIEGSKSILINHILEAFHTKPHWAAKDLFEYLHRGGFGLSKEQYELLILALVHSGTLMPYRDNIPFLPTKTTLSNIEKIEGFRLAEHLSTEELNLISSLPFLPANLKKKKLSITQQKELWQTLIEFKKTLTPKLKALKGFLNEHSHHPILSYSNPSLIKKTARVFEDLLSSIDPSLRSTLGLKQFIKTLKEITFSDIHYSYLQALLNFYEKRQKILFIYEYFHHPYLRLPKTNKKLKSLYEKVSTIFRKDLTSSPLVLISLEEAFNLFHKTYIKTYIKEHQANLSPRCFSDYFLLKQGEDYKLLKAWASLSFLPAKSYLESFETELNGVLKQVCQARVSNYLDKTPLCLCRWPLGEKIYLPSISNLKARLEEGISASLKALLSPPLRHYLKTYLDTLKEIKDEERVKQIESILEGRGEIRQWIGATPQLKNAFYKKVSIVERNLDSLFSQLQGQSLPKSKLEAIFKDWLEEKEKLPVDTYIKLTTSSHLIPPSLEILIQELDPRFTPLVKKWKENFFSLLVFIAWCNSHKLPISIATELAGIPEIEWQDKKPSVLKLALTLLREEAFKQWAKGLEDEDRLLNILKAYKPNLLSSLEQEMIFPKVKAHLLAHLLEMKEEIPLSNLDEETKGLILSYQSLSSLMNETFGGCATKEVWERFLKESFGYMEWHLGKIIASNLPPSFKGCLLKQLSSWSKKIEENFKQSYKQITPTLPSLPSQGIAILLEGLRFDLWYSLKEKLLPLLGYQVQKERFYWINPQADVSTKLKTLGLDNYLQNLSSELHLLKKGNLKVFKIDLIETYICQSRLWPHQLANEVNTKLKNLLEPLLKGTRSLFIFSTYGFKMQIDSVLKPTYKKSFYTCGGVSPQEIITPWATLVKNPNRFS